MWERRVGCLARQLSDGAGRGGVRQFRRPLEGRRNQLREDPASRSRPYLSSMTLRCSWPSGRATSGSRGSPSPRRSSPRARWPCPTCCTARWTSSAAATTCPTSAARPRARSTCASWSRARRASRAASAWWPCPRRTSPSAAGLAGKTIAVNLTSNIQTLMTNVQLKAAGVSPSSVKYVAIPFPDMGAALKAGRVDRDQRGGALPVRRRKPPGPGRSCPTAREPPLTCRCPVTSPPRPGPRNTRAPRPAFQRAMAKAQALANSDPAAVRQVLPTYTKITAGGGPRHPPGDLPSQHRRRPAAAGRHPDAVRRPAGQAVQRAVHDLPVRIEEARDTAP